MKIVISSNSTWNIYNFRYKLINTLINKGHSIIIVSSSDKYKNFLLDIGCRYIKLNINSNKISIYNDIKLLIGYFRILKSEKPDIYLSFTIKPNIYGGFISRLLGIKRVSNITGLGKSFIKKSLLKNIVIFLYKISLKKTYQIFFHNKDDLLLFNKLNISTLNNSDILPGSGININKYSYTPSINNENINFTFLYLGRVRWDKGIKELIKVIPLIKKDYKKINFQILGSIDSKNPDFVSLEYLEKWTKEGLIEYLGESENVSKYIVKSDCVVLLSYREGLPKSLLEASAIGRPLIASNVPGCNRIVKNKINGYLCELDDINDIYQNIINFINLGFNDKIKMGLNANVLVKKEFNEEIVINKYLRIINKVIKK